MNRVRAYPVGQENIALAGAKAKARQRVCLSQKREYGWLRMDPCVEYAEDAQGIEPIKSSRDIAKLAAETFQVGARMQEMIWVISLDVRNRPMGWEEVFRGGRDSAMVDRVKLLQSPLLVGASAFILLHNHPSEEANPSPEDIELTAQVKGAAKQVGLQLLDHIILTRHADRYFSFLDAGML